ncbi:hypothetical protein [Krasilnikovia sp. M28-CT-15]|uniref:hypothetical protein n=1 Tax=Krasilnikovia sp. M28-CT-15 TaxID=3373540 RepID=UPI0038766B3D
MVVGQLGQVVVIGQPQQEAPEATASVLAFGSQQAPASAAAVAVPQQGLVATGAAMLVVLLQPQLDVVVADWVVGSVVISISLVTVRIGRARQADADAGSEDS